jgi:hypothetical protein
MRRFAALSGLHQDCLDKNSHIDVKRFEEVEADWFHVGASDIAHRIG